MFSAPILLRLSLLPGGPNPHTKDLLRQSLACLRILEGDIRIPVSDRLLIQQTHNRPPTRPAAPHQSYDLFEIPQQRDIYGWGESVEALWRVSMSVEEKIKEWDELTARLLLWRGAVGDEYSSVGEWARRQTVSMLLAS